MFDDYNESPENLVEVELCFQDNFTVPLPVRGKDGLLDFERESYELSTLPIRVPKEVAQDKALLRKYYAHKFESSHCLGIPVLNIWDEEKEDFTLPW